jgi:Zn-dependent alcohol dehydrogenase
MVVRGEHGLGHESAGTIIKVGPGVTTFKEGLSPFPNCSEK